MLWLVSAVDSAVLAALLVRGVVPLRLVVRDVVSTAVGVRGLALAALLVQGVALVRLVVRDVVLAAVGVRGLALAALFLRDGGLLGRGSVGGLAAVAALGGLLWRGTGGRVLTTLAAARNDPHRHLPGS
ncbi:hypothetical protein AB0L06_05565 [Spirillospora sp. NPDC052269]